LEKSYLNQEYVSSLVSQLFFELDLSSKPDASIIGEDEI